jgi:nitroimidazol reductase NimA-like FMN-containing flavoprotein (pyridoxamine 5'-phosphate oxidase superfamily)
MRSVFETDADLEELQRTFDQTIRAASPHMGRVIRPEHLLTARQVVAFLQGPRYVAFTTIAGNEPHASPLSSIFVRGRFTMATARGAEKVRDLRANPACSVVHMDDGRIAVVANGRAEWIEPGHPDHDAVHGAWTDAEGSDPYTWGDIALFRLQPVTMWAYADDPTEFPEA